MDEMFTSADQCNIKTTRSSSNKLLQPHCNKVSGYKAISFLGPKLWNKLPIETRTCTFSRRSLRKMMIALFITNFLSNNSNKSIKHQAILSWNYLTDVYPKEDFVRMPKTN